MKKVLLAAAAVMVLGLVGCSKNVDCNCHWEANGQSYPGMPEVTLTDQSDCDKPELPAEVQATYDQMAALGVKLVCKEK